MGQCGSSRWAARVVGIAFLIAGPLGAPTVVRATPPPAPASPHLVLHTLPGPATGYGAVTDPSSGHTFFPSPGAVVVADTATGIIVQTVPVAHAETSFSLNAAQRRVIALSHSDTGNEAATATTIDTVSGRPLRTEQLATGQCGATLASTLSRLLVLCTPPIAGQGATEGPAILKTLDTTSGAVIASTPIGLSGPHTFYAGPALDKATGKAFISWARPSPAATAGPHLAHYVTTIDIAMGHALRTVQLATPGGFSNTLAVDALHGRVVDIAGGADHAGARYPTTLSLLAAADGTLTATVTITAPPHDYVDAAADGPPIDTITGHAYIPTAGGLVVVDTASGAIGPTLPITIFPSELDDMPYGLAIDATHGRAIANDLAGDGQLRVFDLSSGTLVRTLSLTSPGTAQPPPVLQAVDPAAERLYVVAEEAGDRIVLLAIDDVTGATVADVALQQGRIDRGMLANSSMALDAHAHRLAIFLQGDTADGGIAPPSLTILDTTSATIIARPAPACGPAFTVTAVTVDRATDRLYCVDQGGVNHDVTGLQGDPGALSVWDLRSGRSLARIGLAPFPAPAALVGATGYALLGTSIVVPAVPLPSDPVRASGRGALYFSQTRHTLSDAFLAFWRRYGGVDTFGYPQTEPYMENGQTIQYLDRSVLEVVGGIARTVPLDDFSVDRRSFAPINDPGPGRGRRYFPSTHHTLSGRFLAYWLAHHGDVVLGAPISEPFVEGNEDGSGRRYLLQWFEKGRLEYHPELAGTRYEVEPGLVGLQALRQRGWHP